MAFSGKMQMLRHAGEVSGGSSSRFVTRCGKDQTTVSELLASVSGENGTAGGTDDLVRYSPRFVDAGLDRSPELVAELDLEHLRELLSEFPADGDGQDSLQAGPKPRFGPKPPIAHCLQIRQALRDYVQERPERSPYLSVPITRKFVFLTCNTCNIAYM